jgi:hypothetical protein
MIGPVPLLAWLFAVPPAHAVSNCGSLGVRGLVVFGLVDGEDHLGVCEYTPAGGGTWTLTEIPTCDQLDGATMTVFLWDDGVGASGTVIGPVERTGGIECDGEVLLPFEDYFDFGLSFQGGSGTDLAYGTPNNDVLRSNLTSVTTTPNDSNAGHEVLCGYEGNDELISDNFPAVGVCLNGGDGVGPGTKNECTVNSARRIDAVYDCDTVANNPGQSVNCYDCDCGETADDSFFPSEP